MQADLNLHCSCAHMQTDLNLHCSCAHMQTCTLCLGYICLTTRIRCPYDVQITVSVRPLQGDLAIIVRTYGLRDLYYAGYMVSYTLDSYQFDKEAGSINEPQHEIYNNVAF